MADFLPKDDALLRAKAAFKDLGSALARLETLDETSDPQAAAATVMQAVVRCQVIRTAMVRYYRHLKQLSGEEHPGITDERPIPGSQPRRKKKEVIQ